jgi:multicomponent K+:H+ antiporter subunit G
MTSLIHPITELLAAALLLAASFFMLVGAIGLVRLPDFFMRLHAPTKASTLGVGGILLASMIVSAAQGRIGFAELLIALFIFVTAPVSANLMGQAALHLRVKTKVAPPVDAVPERRSS